VSSTRKELVLIGTVHRDPEGLSKALCLLTKENPASVAVEVSPYALYFRRRNGRLLRRRLLRRLRLLARTQGVAWRDWGQIQAIFSQLRLPFEYQAASRYCRDAGASFHCLDSSPWSKRHIQSNWAELLSSDNLAALLSQPPEDMGETVQKGYELAAKLLSKPGVTLVSALVGNWSVDIPWQRREAELAGCLARIFANMRYGRLAYIGGWQHLLSPTRGGTLYERLEILRPRRMLLNGAPGHC
jgi:hypothetical protein